MTNAKANECIRTAIANLNEVIDMLGNSVSVTLHFPSEEYQTGTFATVAIFEGDGSVKTLYVDPDTDKFADDAHKFSTFDLDACLAKKKEEEEKEDA